MRLAAAAGVTACQPQHFPFFLLSFFFFWTTRGDAIVLFSVLQASFPERTLRNPLLFWVHRVSKSIASSQPLSLQRTDFSGDSYPASALRNDGASSLGSSFLLFCVIDTPCFFLIYQTRLETTHHLIAGSWAHCLPVSYIFNDISAHNLSSVDFFSLDLFFFRPLFWQGIVIIIKQHTTVEKCLSSAGC